MTDITEETKKKVEMSLDDAIKLSKSNNKDDRGFKRRGNRRGGDRRGGDRRGGFRNNDRRGRGNDRRNNRNFKPYRRDDDRDDWRAGKRSDQDVLLVFNLKC